MSLFQKIAVITVAVSSNAHGLRMNTGDRVLRALREAEEALRKAQEENGHLKFEKIMLGKRNKELQLDLEAERQISKLQKEKIAKLNEKLNELRETHRKEIDWCNNLGEASKYLIDKLENKVKKLEKLIKDDCATKPDWKKSTQLLYKQFGPNGTIES